MGTTVRDIFLSFNDQNIFKINFCLMGGTTIGGCAYIADYADANVLITVWLKLKNMSNYNTCVRQRLRTDL